MLGLQSRPISVPNIPRRAAAARSCWAAANKQFAPKGTVATSDYNHPFHACRRIDGVKGLHGEIGEQCEARRGGLVQAQST